MNTELDRLLLQGKLTEEEYLVLAMDNSQILAVAVDETDMITTISLSLESTGYLGEILYSPYLGKKDEKFVHREKSFRTAQEAFSSRIKALEASGKHKFDVTWFNK